MGEQRVSIRTLDDGTVVRHSPPDDEHPEGRMDLVTETSPLREELVGRRDDNKARQEELRALHAKRIADKKAAQAARGLPPEKSPL